MKKNKQNSKVQSNLVSDKAKYALPTPGISNPNYTPLTQSEAGKYNQEDLVLLPSTSKRTVNRLNGKPTQYFLKNYGKSFDANNISNSVNPSLDGYSVQGSIYKYDNDENLVFDKKDPNIYNYSLGGIVGGAASGASTGVMLGSVLPGIGNVIGGAIGGGIGLVKGMFDHFKEKKAERQAAAALNLQRLESSQNSAAVSLNAGGSFNNFRDPWVAANGGVVPGGQVSELAGEEVSMGPDQSLKKWDLPKHPNNSRIPLEEGSVVFPEKLDVPANSTLRKYGKTFAEAANSIRKQKDIMQKRLDSKSTTPIARRTAERNIYNLDRQLGSLTGALMSEHQRLGIQQPTASDGTPQADWGTIIKGAGKVIKGASKFLASDTGMNLAGTVGSLAPTLLNLKRGNEKAEVLNPANFQNPMAYDALQSMSGRQVDVNPIISGIDESAAIASSNLRNSGMGAGAYRAGISGVQNASMKAKSAMYSQADIQNNAYRGELGQMQAGLGQRMADTNLMVSDLNARNEAASRNYGAAAAGQLSQFAQTQLQMHNQQNRDKMLMEQMNGLFNNFKSMGSDRRSISTPSKSFTGNLQIPSFNQTPQGLR